MKQQNFCHFILYLFIFLIYFFYILYHFTFSITLIFQTRTYHLCRLVAACFGIYRRLVKHGRGRRCCQDQALIWLAELVLPIARVCGGHGKASCLVSGCGAHITTLAAVVIEVEEAVWFSFVAIAVPTAARRVSWILVDLVVERRLEETLLLSWRQWARCV